MERYKYLKRGKKPPAFKEKDVEEEIIEQIKKLEMNEKKIK